MEGEKTVQVGKNCGPEIAYLLGHRQAIETGKCLRGQQHVRAILGELPEYLLVVGSWESVEFVDDERDRPPGFRRKDRLCGDGSRGQIEQSAADQGGHIFAYIEGIEIYQD